MATGARRPSLARIGAGPEPNQGPIGEVLGRGSSPTAQNAVTDSVEICLLQGLRDYEIRRAVIIRSIGRPKFVCVPTAPAQLRGVRFS